MRPLTGSCESAQGQLGKQRSKKLGVNTLGLGTAQASSKNSPKSLNPKDPAPALHFVGLPTSVGLSNLKAGPINLKCFSDHVTSEPALRLFRALSLCFFLAFSMTFLVLFGLLVVFWAPGLSWPLSLIFQGFGDP